MSFEVLLFIKLMPTISQLYPPKKEHTYSTRENDAERRYFTIPPSVAPYKCSILPISNKPDFEPSIREITKQLKEKSLPHKVDKSAGSIGKRYFNF